MIKSLDFYRVLFRIKVLFHKWKTRYWYSLFLKDCGNGTVLFNPLLITPRHISIGNNVLIFWNARIEGITFHEGDRFEPSVEFEDNVTVQQNLHLTCANRIHIGKNTAIAANVTISDINHPYDNVDLPVERQRLIVGFVELGDDCKIYNNAVILPNVKLGKHCVVGANSVVLGRSYPDYSVLAGNPARIVKRYCAETAEWRKTNPDGEFKN